MTITRKEIMAYVDGEMDEVARKRITLAALADLDLAARIAKERGLRARLAAHFAPIAQAPVPAQWIDTIHRATTRPTARVFDLAAARKRLAAGTPGWWQRPSFGAALAAALVLGVFVGSQWQASRSTGPIVAHDGLLVASGDLARALNTQLASAQDGDAIRMLGTFRRAGGDLCRSFAGSQASGIACHDSGAWQLQQIMPGTARSPGAYRQAGSQEGELMALAQTMAVGDPLDAAQEREARATGWR